MAWNNTTVDDRELSRYAAEAARIGQASAITRTIKEKTAELEKICSYYKGFDVSEIPKAEIRKIADLHQEIEELHARWTTIMGFSKV